jgi:hypothetical protein
MGQAFNGRPFEARGVLGGEEKAVGKRVSSIRGAPKDELPRPLRVTLCSILISLVYFDDARSIQQIKDFVETERKVKGQDPK